MCIMVVCYATASVHYYVKHETKEVNIMELIKDFKSISRGITGLSKALSNLDAKIHTLAASAGTHALDHNNNWELVTKLVQVVGGYDVETNKFKSRSVRATDLRNWIQSILPIKWSYNKGQGRYITDKKKLANFDEEQARKDLLVPFYDVIKDTGSQFKGFDMEARVRKLIADAAKAQAKAHELGEEAEAKVKTQISDQLATQLLRMCNFDVDIEAANQEVPVKAVG